MENYKKGPNFEEKVNKDSLFTDLSIPRNFLWMKVKGGTKICNVLSYALTEFPNVKYVVWTGYGPAVGKVVTCAELMKRHFDNQLHQITRICYRKIIEKWVPLIPELDTISVNRQLPMIHILLSTDQLDINDSCYQPPGTNLNYQQNQNAQASYKKKFVEKTRHKEQRGLQRMSISEIPKDKNEGKNSNPQTMSHKKSKGVDQNLTNHEIATSSTS